MATPDEPQPEKDGKRIMTAPALVLLLLVLAALIAALLFVNSAVFAVGEVTVEGARYMTAEDVYAIAGIPAQINIFRLDAGHIKKRLLRDLRIAEADVTRKFPATIAITIRERQPLAWVACSYGFVQLDRQGVVITAVKSIKKVDVPIITGARLGTVYIGDKAEPAGVKAALAYLADLDETTLGLLSEVHVTGAGDLVVYTVQPVTIRLGPPDRLPEKAKFTLDVLHDLGDKIAAVEYIDLSYASPYIKFRQSQRKE